MDSSHLCTLTPRSPPSFPPLNLLSQWPDETFALHLRSARYSDLAVPTLNVLPDNDTTMITIKDDGDAGLLSLIPDAYNTTERNNDTNIVIITVSRTNRQYPSGEITVRFYTEDGNARMDDDYAPTSGVLTFGDNVTTQTFPVTILHDDLYEVSVTRVWHHHRARSASWLVVGMMRESSVHSAACCAREDAAPARVDNRS